MADERKVIITCAITGSIHTPSMSPHLPDHAAPDRRCRGRGRGGGRGDRAPARARPGRRTADAGPQVLPRVRRRDTPPQRRGGQFHDRRRGDHDHRGTPAARAAAQARSGVAQHGVDELRALPDACALQGVPLRLGARVPRRRRTRASSGTRSRTSNTSSPPARTTAPASRSSATTSGTSTPRTTSSSAAS